MKDYKAITLQVWHHQYFIQFKRYTAISLPVWPTYISDGPDIVLGLETDRLRLGVHEGLGLLPESVHRGGVYHGGGDH